MIKLMLFASLLAVAMPLGASPVAHQPEGAAIVYVAPNGRDSWSGRLARPNAGGTDGPVASMEGARNLIRKWKARLGELRPVRVLFATGTYPLTKPVTFGLEDSGSTQFPISYEAAPGAKLVFEAGRRISGFVRGANGVWTATVPGVKEG